MPDPEATDARLPDRAIAATEAASFQRGFRVLRPHARGGLGEVLYAEDISLGRPVALKRLFGPGADDPAGQARFVREAEITARLQHPGIVPVYGLTQDAEGRPAYAMRFIEGEPLSSAIARFHTDPDAIRRVTSSASAKLEFRRLLECFASVCDTVAYAHSREVIHRDLKPANIMLGPYGETLVVDWGLAKQLTARPVKQPAEPNAIVERESHSIGSESTSADPAPPDSTRLGQMMGTPAYMSPEQAEGRWDYVGPASDVYSLGATLYCLLTGQAPFKGDALDVISAVGAGRWRPADATATGVSSPLAAICGKAMALDVTNRYPSARDLAVDIRRWLADEPVSAYREPFRLRAARWLRRHRTVSIGVSVLAATALVALGLGLFAVNRERLHTLNERDEARRQRQRTRIALDAMTSGLAQKWLRSTKELGPEQLEFLRSALAYYQEFAADQSDDAAGRRLVAEAHVRMATLLYALDRRSEAEPIYRKSLELWTRISQDDPDNSLDRRQTAEAAADFANLLHDFGRDDEAEVISRQAIENYERLALGGELSSRVQGEWAWASTNRGVILASIDRPADAEPAYRKSVEILRRIVAAVPAEVESRVDLAHAHNNLGNCLRTLGRLADAEASYRQGIAQTEELIKQSPHELDYRIDLSRNLSNLAVVRTRLGTTAEGEELYLRAVGIAEDLVRDRPTSNKYRNVLALNCNNLGQLKRSSGDPTGSLKWFDRAEEVLKALLAEEPKLANERGLLRNVFCGRADALGRLGQWSGAVSQWDRAIENSGTTPPTEIRIRRAYALAKAGNFAGALTEADALSADGKGKPDLYNLACVYAIVHAGSKDDAIAIKAVVHIRRAVSQGYNDLEHLKSNSDFSSLKERADFREILKELAGGASKRIQ